MEKKKILVMGATGSMGHYLVPELLKLGYRVDGVSKDEMTSDNPDLNYYVYNCYDIAVMEQKLKENHYDGVIDFMNYSVESFRNRLPIFLENTDHYLYLSSYRVYANEQVPVTEDAPRLLEASNDEKFLATSSYALSKCRCEDILRESKYNNWTIVRPVIVFAEARIPLITLETATVFNRTNEGKPVLFPKQARDVHASMMWGGDAAKMLARLFFKPEAYGEAFTISTGETVTWGDIVSYFEKNIGLKSIWIDKEEHLRVMSEEPEIQMAHRWGLEYDRLCDRVIDNSKILRVTGLKKEDFMPVIDAMEYELKKVPKDKLWTETGIHKGVSERMDKYLSEH